MNDNKWTPGPWRAVPAGENESEGVFSHIIVSPNYGAVGYWRGRKDRHTDCNWVLTEKDAHLIAAAPAMFEALSKVARVIESAGDVDGYPEIYAALALARGEQA